MPHTPPATMLGRRVCMVGACMAGGYMHSRGACMVVGGHAWQGGVWWGGGACMAGQTATAAYGMHPTGMHSCVKEHYVAVSFAL